MIGPAQNRRCAGRSTSRWQMLRRKPLSITRGLSLPPCWPRKAVETRLGNRSPVFAGIRIRSPRTYALSFNKLNSATDPSAEGRPRRFLLRPLQERLPLLRRAVIGVAVDTACDAGNGAVGLVLPEAPGAARIADRRVVLG